MREQKSTFYIYRVVWFTWVSAHNCFKYEVCFNVVDVQYCYRNSQLNVILRVIDTWFSCQVRSVAMGEVRLVAILGEVRLGYIKLNEGRLDLVNCD